MQVSKMWILIKLHLVLIAIWSAIHIAAGKCPEDHKSIDWNLRGKESSRPVKYLNLTLNNGFGSKATLELHAKNFKANFTLILFALPRDKNDPPCPSKIGKNMDLRKQRCAAYIPRDAHLTIEISYDAIMTGCFYVVMRNGKGTYWQEDPVFYETNYNFVDTKLKLAVDNENMPEKRGSSRELRPVIKVPLRCLQVIATLYEFKGKVPNATIYAKNGILPEGGKEQQICTIYYDGNHKTVKRNCTGMNTKLEIDADLIDEQNDTWTAKIIWSNLRRGGNTYYMTFFPVVVNQCMRKYPYINRWKPIDEIIFHGGYFDESNDPSGTEDGDNVFIIGISCSLAGMLVMVMLVYWKLKCSRFMINKEIRESEESTELQTLGSIFNGKEFDQILIMYVEGPPLLMKAIRDLKDNLKRKCNCLIRDVYELNEWLDVADLGATEWVERQMKAGSRVVWIDTPQFRSFLNDKEKKYAGDDFRDEVLPYAVDLIKPLFQDATTQYLRHFVVQIKGAEFDDRQTDPLQTLTPHVRYCLPDHLSDLIKHLNNCPPKSLENRGNV